MARTRPADHRAVRPETGEFGTIVAVLGAVIGRLACGQPLGLQLVQESGEIDGIAGVLDAVPERPTGVLLPVWNLLIEDVR